MHEKERDSDGRKDDAIGDQVAVRADKEESDAAEKGKQIPPQDGSQQLDLAG